MKFKQVKRFLLNKEFKIQIQELVLWKFKMYKNIQISFHLNKLACLHIVLKLK